MAGFHDHTDSERLFPGCPSPVQRLERGEVAEECQEGEQDRERQHPTLERRPQMPQVRSEEHTSELQSQSNLVCRLLLEKKKTKHADEAAIHVPNLHKLHVQASDRAESSAPVQLHHMRRASPRHVTCRHGAITIGMRAAY